MDENFKSDIQKSSRNKILAFEKAMSHLPDAQYGDQDDCPIKHSFADGIYVREIFIPKGKIIVGKIHRHSHPNFLMSGEVLVATEHGGSEHLKAPISMISPPSTKRVVYALTDVVWITVHNVGEERDLDKIEDIVICKSYDELDKQIINQKPDEIEAVEVGQQQEQKQEGESQ